MLRLPPSSRIRSMTWYISKPADCCLVMTRSFHAILEKSRYVALRCRQRRLQKPHDETRPRVRTETPQSFHPSHPFHVRVYTVSGVPYWGPYSKGILLFGHLYWGSPTHAARIFHKELGGRETLIKSVRRPRHCSGMCAGTSQHPP